jgi:NAD(P)-dependent dehydrogenase (short-subunit alcohol dehydrogenase family)
MTVHSGRRRPLPVTTTKRIEPMDANSRKWTAADLPNLSGQTVVITGASSGLGAITARELARAGARVVMAVRDTSKGKSVADTIPRKTEVFQLDLTNLESIRRFAESWTGEIDVLINNAGVMYAPEGRTSDGFELHIGTNHLGHFALTNLLLPHITDRVVTLTSNLASRGKIDLDDLNWEHRTYKSSQAYSDSKQANILFTDELQRRLAKMGSSVRAISSHPGVAKTSLIGHVGGFAGTMNKLVVRVIAQSAEHGARSTLFAATQDVPGGSFVGPNGPGHMRGYPELADAPKSSRDADTTSRLWGLSVHLTGTDVTKLSGRSAA